MVVTTDKRKKYRDIEVTEKLEFGRILSGTKKQKRNIEFVMWKGRNCVELTAVLWRISLNAVMNIQVS